MCGIAGVVCETADRRQVIGRMNDKLIHRGPDAEGIWLDENSGLCLGHRRLAIRDLSEAGAQPMISASGRFVIAYNGEIYNTGDIMKEIEKAGARPAYRGTSDTEVLLEAFECLGAEKVLGLAKGMFALALYDRQERELLLARDRIGEKPLYYGRIDGKFAFASEISALKEVPGFSGEINREIIPAYMLLGYIPAPATVYSGIYKLVPGGVLRLSYPFGEEQLRKGRYYDIRRAAEEASQKPFAGSFKEAADELERLLKDAVRGQLKSDVPVGTYLSGGIDSACVTALAASVNPENTSSFSIGFEEKKYDEAPEARKIAEHLGTKHTEQYVGEKEMKEVIGKLPFIYGEPFADSSQIPTYLVSRMAKEHVTVVLSGDAGDELFAGYATYPKMLALWNKLKICPAGVRNLAGRTAAACAGDSKTLYRGGKCLQAGNIRELKAAVDHYDPYFYRLCGESVSIRKKSLGLSTLKEMLVDDLMVYHPEDILVKVDRAGMAVSLENRIPMLDKDVVAFALSLPDEYLLDGKTGKKVLKEVLYRYVPREMMERPKKGFAVPLDRWLSEGHTREWAEDLMLCGTAAADGLIVKKEAEALWKAFCAGKRSPRPVWHVLMLEQWYRMRGEL